MIFVEHIFDFSQGVAQICFKFSLKVDVLNKLDIYQRLRIDIEKNQWCLLIEIFITMFSDLIIMKLF